MFKDEHGAKVWDQIRQHAVPASSTDSTVSLLPGGVRRAGFTPGRGPLHQDNLAWPVVAAASHPAKRLADVLMLTPPRPASRPHVATKPAQLPLYARMRDAA